jgi:hypothetical protein
MTESTDLLSVSVTKPALFVKVLASLPNTAPAATAAPPLCLRHHRLRRHSAVGLTVPWHIVHEPLVSRFFGPTTIRPYTLLAAPVDELNNKQTSTKNRGELVRAIGDLLGGLSWWTSLQDVIQLGTSNWILWYRVFLD